MKRMISFVLALSMAICGAGGVWMSDTMSMEVVEAKGQPATVTEQVVETTEEIQGTEVSKTNAKKTSRKKVKKKTEKKVKKSNYIVVTKSQKALNKLEDKYDTRKTSELQEMLPKENIIALKVTEKTAEKIEDRNDVVLVEKDIPVKACSRTAHKFNRKRIRYEDAAKPEQDMEWNFQSIKLDKEVKNKARKGKSNKRKVGEKEQEASQKVKVAILDSGVDYMNDIEIEESINLIPGEEEMSPLFIDDTGHGTSVAGIVAATKNEEGITGINDNVELYSARILSDDSAPISRVVEGIYWAIGKEVNIINLSFSTPNESQVLKQAIEDAHKAGILIIAAAGNGGTVEYPAAYDEVIAVGSVDAEGVVSEESSTGNELDVVAPGEKVLSSSLLGGTLVTSGTSLSAPHVVGVASLLWEKDLAVSSDFIRELILASANGYGDKLEYGNGLIDYEYALEIYDDLKKKYYAEQPTEARAGVADVDTESLEGAESIIIEENESDIVTFEENTYVEGRWANHDDMAANYTTIEAFQKGAKEPDSNNNLKGLGDNHGWHGGRFLNFVAIYRYLNKVARAVDSVAKGAGVSNVNKAIKSVEAIEGIEDGHFGELQLVSQAKYMNGVQAGLENDLCNYVASKLNGMTKAEKEAFVFGMASHVATDVYAHSSYRYNRYNWTWIRHEKDPETQERDPSHVFYADRVGCVPRRFESAREVLEKVVLRFNNCRSGIAIVRDFAIDSPNTDGERRAYYSVWCNEFLDDNDTNATYRLYHFQDHMLNAGERDQAHLTMYELMTVRPDNATK